MKALALLYADSKEPDVLRVAMPITAQYPEKPAKNVCFRRLFVIAMSGACHYNAHAIYQARLEKTNPKRHTPPGCPMDVAFLVPEA